MKARVKATGKIVDVELYYTTPRIKTYTDGSQYYNGDELDFNVEYTDPNYWTRLEHQAAIAAMRGMLTTTSMGSSEQIAEWSIEYAHALVEKYKKEE